ncbi:hypothetical protein [Haloparvum sp. AD34]
MNNSTIYSARGHEIVVEQGPVWLAKLIYAPPWWLLPLLKVVSVCVVGLAAVGYWRHGVSPEVIRESAENGLIALCCLGTSKVVVNTVDLGYVYEVILGAGGGYLIAMAIVKASYKIADRTGDGD